MHVSLYLPFLLDFTYSTEPLVRKKTELEKRQGTILTEKKEPVSSEIIKAMIFHKGKEESCTKRSNKREALSFARTFRA